MFSAPNVHPMVVHFPIVLLLVALAAEGASQAWPWTHHERWCTGAWGAAALGATAAFVSGRLAADSIVGIPALVQPALSEHADLALSVLVLAWGVAALKVGQHWARDGWKRAVGGAVMVLGLAVNGVVAATADHGGALVFQHALGVTVPDCPMCLPPPTVAAPAQGASGALAVNDDGTTLTWTATPQQLPLLGGKSWPTAGTALAVDGHEELILPQTLGDVQVNAWVDLRAFSGTVQVLHHVSDAGSGALSVDTSGAFRLETLTPTLSTLDEGTTEPVKNVLSINIVGTHIKGLVDGQTVAHGHTAARPPGRVGVRFEGVGVVAVHRLEAIRLDEHGP